MEVYIFIKLMERFDSLDQKFSELADKINGIVKQQEAILANLVELTAEVARNTTVDESAIALLNGLAAQIEQLKTDPAALQSLANNLRASSDNLAAAVVANTPSAP